MKKLLTYIQNNKEFSIILFVALLLRIILAAVKEFHADELFSLYASEMILHKGIPVYPSGVYRILGGLLLYIQAPFIALFGYNELLVRIPSIFFSCGAIFLTYHFAKELFSKNIALLAVFFVAFDVDLINWGGISTKPYSLTPFLLLLIFYFLRQSTIKNSLKLLIISSLLIIISLWIHPLLTLYLPAIFLAYFIWIKKFSFKNLFIFTSIVLVGLITVFLSAYFFDRGIVDAASGGESSNYIALFKSYVFKLYSSTVRFYSNPFYTSHLHRVIMFFPFVFILLSYFTNLIFSETKIIWKNQTFEDVFAIGFTVFVTLIIHNILPFNFVYYTIPLLPIFYIVASKSVFMLFSGDWFSKNNAIKIEEFKDFSKKQKIIIVTLLVGIFGLMMKDLKPEFKNTNYLQAYKFVKKQWKSGDVILNCNPATYIFAIDQKDAQMYFFTENPDINIMKNNDGQIVDRVFGMPSITNEKQLDSLFDIHSRIWFILNKNSAHFNFPTTLNFINSNMKLVYETQASQVYLKE